MPGDFSAPASRLRPALIALLVGLCASGCMLGAPPCGGSSRPLNPRLDVLARDDNPLIADASVHLDEPAAIFVEYGSAQLGWLRTPAAGLAADHQLALLRLRAETEYEVRAFALDGAGCPVANATAKL